MSPDTSTSALHRSALHRFALDYVEPHAAQDAEQTPRPDSGALLRNAFQRYDMEVRDIDGSGQTLLFAGAVVGGLEGHLTTLVRAYGRAVSEDPAVTREHMTARKLPVPAEGSDPHTTLPLEVFVVGGTPVSAIVRVPSYTPQAAAAASGTAQPAAVDFGPDAAEHRWSEGTVVDVFDAVSQDVLTMAGDAVRAIPGIGAAAVCLNLPRLESPRGATVEAVIVDADIAAHEQPDIGIRRGVSDAIAQQILERASK